MNTSKIIIELEDASWQDVDVIKMSIREQIEKYIAEYNTLNQNSRYKLTGFSGSTGDALITPSTIFLFVDGRYHIQFPTLSVKRCDG